LADNLYFNFFLIFVKKRWISDDEIRTDQIGLDEIKKFGYSFLDNDSIKFSDLFEEDEEYADFDDFDDEDEYLEESIDEGEVVSFLTEYYLVNSRNLPNAELF